MYVQISEQELNEARVIAATLPHSQMRQIGKRPLYVVAMSHLHPRDNIMEKFDLEYGDGLVGFAIVHDPQRA